MTTNAYQTRGHSATAPGLRGHSCGDTYPLIVIARGRPAAPMWHVFNCRTGAEGRACRTYAEANIDLYSIKVRNLIHS